MWFLMAIVSAMLLGLYDVAKKYSLKGNAVIPVLFLNTLISTFLFLPLIIGSKMGYVAPDSLFFVASGSWEWHGWIVLKAIIVLSSWICGYFAIKHLPLTLAGPINATRPVMVVVGALLLFGEHLNSWQWAGVLVAIAAFAMLSRSGRKEGIDFTRNRWIFLLIAAAILGACSGLYDKYLMARISLPAFFVQSWFNVYQSMMMLLAFVGWRYWQRHCSPEHRERFAWRWSIICISLFLCAADACYFHALAFEDALIAVVSMTRRSSVLVSFLFGALFLKEKRIRDKALDLLLVLLSMVFLCIGASC